MFGYVQPIAQHTIHPERLLLRGDDGSFAVWFGEAVGDTLVDDDLVTVDAPLAAWIYAQPQMCPLPQPSFWFSAADLPATSRSSVPD